MNPNRSTPWGALARVSALRFAPKGLMRREPQRSGPVLLFLSWIRSGVHSLFKSGVGSGITCIHAVNHHIAYFFKVFIGAWVLERFPCLSDNFTNTGPDQEQFSTAPCKQLEVENARSDKRAYHVPVSHNHPGISVLVRARGTQLSNLSKALRFKGFDEPSARGSHFLFAAQFIQAQYEVRVVVSGWH